LSWRRRSCFYASQPYIEPCDASRPRQQWITNSPINYGTSYGYSYRLRWAKDTMPGIDNEGPTGVIPLLRTCLSGPDPAGKINRQWYFQSMK
jgi:hypothetical protein